MQRHSPLLPYCTAYIPGADNIKHPFACPFCGRTLSFQNEPGRFDISVRFSPVRIPIFPDTANATDEYCLLLAFAEGGVNQDYTSVILSDAAKKYLPQGYQVKVKRCSPELNGQLYYLKVTSTNTRTHEAVHENAD